MTAIYLDNAATSFPKPENVYLAVDSYQREVGGNPGRATHARALRAEEIFTRTRKSLARLCGIPDPSRIVFAFNGTQALNVGLKGLLKPGDHVLTSALDHNAVNRPLFKLASLGVSVTRIPCDPKSGIDLIDVAQALRAETRMIVLTHSSNVFGTMLPLTEIGELARARGVLFFVDAAQTLGYCPLEVEAMHIDLLAAPGHKGLFGPEGTGFLYIRDGLTLDTLCEGGTGYRSEMQEQPEWLPDRFEAGTPNGPGIAGLGAGAEFVLQEGLEVIAKKKRNLIAQLWNGLAGIDQVRLYGPEPLSARTAVVSFNLEGIPCDSVGAILDSAFEIQVRSGLHCAPFAHMAAGTYPAGTVRVSPGYFNTEADIETLILAVREIARKRQG
jgi:cysteine desulfurase / selenocysteine lyase